MARLVLSLFASRRVVTLFFIIFVDDIRFAGSGKFTDNFALNGGAIYNAAAVTFITGSAYFHGNQAGEIGGAVLNVFGVDDTTPGTIVFSEDYVWFEENGAEVRGSGAICISQGR